MIGIYKFTAPNGAIYIGQARNLERRYLEYQTELIKKHRRLYQSVLQFGFEAHVYEVVEYCNFSDLNERERFYQDLYDVCGERGLNCRLTMTDNKKGFLVPESRDKIRGSHIGKTRTDLTKSRISQTRKEKLIPAWNKGIARTNEVKAKLKASRTGKRIGADHPTAKTILNMETGVFFDTMKEAALSNGLNYSTLNAYLKNVIPNRTALIYV
ncbi:GIY-YIG nuclease family protein [Pedobacter panaciterrae]|uniref:GIY-YIG nuclease family protein n=1 Tax=Pedobacter panaciterrae TaxID=363849 RepID=A0ABU8NS19_9SPHI